MDTISERFAIVAPPDVIILVILGDPRFVANNR